MLGALFTLILSFGFGEIHSTKTELVAELVRLQKSQLQILDGVDAQLDQHLKQLKRMQVDADHELAAMTHLPNSLKALKSRQHEYALRREFLDRLIFQIESKWSGENLKVFLENALLEMARADLKDETGEVQSATFASYLSVAVRELAEQDEHLAHFVEAYMNFSTLTSPKAPHRFLAERSYHKGSLTYRAKPMSLEEAGDFVEQKLKTLKNKNAKSQLRSRAS